MKLHQFLIILVLTNIISAEKRAIFGDSGPPTAYLKNGLKLIGRSDTTAENNIYYSFRGIPFVKPPVGELRFKPPVPLTGNYIGQTRLAQTDGSPCPQILGTSVAGSEDCLYINVYTPIDPKIINLQLLPVIVWVHGGGFLGGASNYEYNRPDGFMNEKGVIIVSFNYRLGMLGFLSTEDNASPGNYGLLDQIEAMKWVKDNIRYFGGNPDKVTIMGQSAGAASIAYLAQSPLTTGLYSRAILISGSTLCPWSFIRKPRTGALAAAKALNINTTNSEALVAGLRNVDFATLITVQTSLILTLPLYANPYNGFLFGPTVEPPHSGAVVVTTSHGLLTKGSFQHVPYVLGFTSLEGIAQLEIFNAYTSAFGDQSLAPESLRIYDPVAEKQADAEIRNHYLVDNSDTNNAQFISDNEFVRPILETASLYSQQQLPVYLYRFSYEGYASKNRTYQGPGVAHAEDAVYIWQVAANPSPTDLAISKRLITYWINFAKTGNPTPTSDPVLQNVRWPRTTTAGNGNLAYLDIGTNSVTGVNPNWQEYQWWKGIFAKYGNSPYDTY